MLLDRNLSLYTKRMIYQACVMSVLLNCAAKVLDSTQEAYQEAEHFPS